ncbi:Kinetochore protein NDC80 [Zea mays]|uniref:Kinetochore protein NDC80 n=1 Tax=Zea mays TaxID=4577 RepID=A0A317YLS4_MAIZE|nr:Kinetochore protein NDC80 [Zea mays]
MRRGGGRRFPKPSLAPSTAAEATPALDASVIRNLDSAFSRRDSDANSLCSSRPASTVGAILNFSDRATQVAALRVVNTFLAPAVTLRGPLPAARDIQAALRLLVDRLHLPRNDATFDDDLIQDLRLLGCPYKVTRSALKAPGTPHSWPVLLSVLHWLTLLCHSQGDDLDAPSGPSDDLLLYITQSYSHFLSGDDAAVETVDEEYASKARMTGEAYVATARALEKEAEELETQVNKLISGPSRREALESEKEAFNADIHKFDAVVNAWKTKFNEREQSLGDLEKELEAKVSDTQRAAAEIQDLLKQVDAQPVNVKDVDRMRREMQAIEDDIANAEKGKTALEDKVWELEAKLVTKLEELERHAEQCNQALKKLKPTVAFQYMIDSKGSSPAEMLGTGYKTVLKPALLAHAEENKRICLSNLENLNDLQKQLQGNAKIVARLNLLDREIINDDSRFTSEAAQMKDELEKKKNSLISAEKQADDFLKKSEKRLQDVTLKVEEETQAAAKELLELLDSMAEHKEFMETTIAQRRKDLYETADYIASVASKTVITQVPNPPES